MQPVQKRSHAHAFGADSMSALPRTWQGVAAIPPQQLGAVQWGDHSASSADASHHPAGLSAASHTRAATAGSQCPRSEGVLQWGQPSLDPSDGMIFDDGDACCFTEDACFAADGWRSADAWGEMADEGPAQHQAPSSTSALRLLPRSVAVARKAASVETSRSSAYGHLPRMRTPPPDDCWDVEPLQMQTDQNAAAAISQDYATASGIQSPAHRNDWAGMTFW